MNIQFSNEYKIGFGMFCTFPIKIDEIKSHAYKASEEALQELSLHQGCENVIAVEIENEVCVITAKEKEILGLEEAEAEWYIEDNHREEWENLRRGKEKTEQTIGEDIKNTVSEWETLCDRGGAQSAKARGMHVKIKRYLSSRGYDYCTQNLTNLGYKRYLKDGYKPTNTFICIE